MRASRVFIANYDDICGLCGERVHEGEKVAFYDDEVCHRQCIEDEAPEALALT